MLSARVCASPLARAGAVSRPRRCSLRSVAARVAAPEAPVEAYIVSDDEESDSDWEEYSSDEDEVLNPPLSTYVPTNDLVKAEIEEVEDFEEPEEEWNQDYEDVMAEAFCFGKPDDMWGFGGKEEGEEDDMEWGEEEKKILFATWNQWYKDGREIVSDEVKDVCNWPLDMRPLSEQYAEIDELVENEPDLPQLGDLVTVEVTSVSEEGATVWSEDFAATLDVAVNDLTALSIEHANEITRPGMKMVLQYVGTDREDFLPIFSREEIEKELLKERITDLEEADVMLPATVTSGTMAGLNVDAGGIYGFIPGSHITADPNFKEEDVTEEEREAMVGKTIMVKFLARDEEDDKITFSAKRAGVGAVIMDDFKIGDVVEGIVSRVVEYGAFIDVVEGNGQGLLHISQVSHDRITNITDLLDIGDKIKVMIMAHDPERNRLAFSTKKLEPTPGDMLRDPAKVFANAEDMAELFKIRVLAAEQAAQEEEAKLLQQAEQASEYADFGSQYGDEYGGAYDDYGGDDAFY